MIPAWYRLAQQLDKIAGAQKDPLSLTDSEKRAGSAALALRRTRQALGTQHPMEQTEAYRRAQAVYLELTAAHA